MPILAVAAALSAAALWAVCSILSHGPAKALGSLSFNRIQMISASLVLLVLVTLLNGWSSVDWAYWPHFLFSAAVGVVGANLATVEALRRGGPRREQVLRVLNAPVAVLLGFIFLHETPSAMVLFGGALVLAGILVAILFGHHAGDNSKLEEVHGSLWVVIGLGVFAAFCNAAGLVALKPALVHGIDPLAVSFLRTGGAAILIAALGFVTARGTAVKSSGTRRDVIGAMVPGFLGYIVAVNLLLFALRSYDTGIVVVLASVAPVLLLPMLWIKTGRAPPPAAWFGAALAVVGAAIILFSK